MECSYGECGNPVFARGVCRKHYERERLATASPCSVLNCTAKSTKRGMCDSHYQAWRKTQTPLCVIPQCKSHSRGKKYGLCQKHEFRYRKHGSTTPPRPADWGSRREHPLYELYISRRRHGARDMCIEWREDFWGFVEGVGEKPAGHTLRRKDTTLPLGPGNWYWKESFSNKNKSEYQKKWRERNPRRAKSNDLRRSYGITLEDYEALLEAQNGVCAICGDPEKTKDKDGGPRKMPVDHDHETGVIRGLLCTPCNRALGMLKDDVKVLRRAIVYITSHAP